MSAVLLLLRGVPILAYVCGVLFLGLAYERHEATHWKNEWTLLKAQDATAKIVALEQAKTETERRNTALKGEIDDANQRAAVAAADAASSAAATTRLSGQLANVKRQLGTANHSTAAVDVDATRQAVGVLADLLSERQRADAARSKFADDAYSASIGCKRQYEALTPP